TASLAARAARKTGAVARTRPPSISRLPPALAASVSPEATVPRQRVPPSASGVAASRAHAVLVVAHRVPIDQGAAVLTGHALPDFQPLTDDHERGAIRPRRRGAVAFAVTRRTGHLLRHRRQWGDAWHGLTVDQSAAVLTVHQLPDLQPLADDHQRGAIRPRRRGAVALAVTRRTRHLAGHGQGGAEP